MVICQEINCGVRFMCYRLLFVATDAKTQYGFHETARRKMAAAGGSRYFKQKKTLFVAKFRFVTTIRSLFVREDTVGCDLCVISLLFELLTR
jgi:hypothetical protein